MRDEYYKIKIGYGENTKYIIAKKGERVRLPDGTFIVAGSNIEDQVVTKFELKQMKKTKKLELKNSKK